MEEEEVVSTVGVEVLAGADFSSFATELDKFVAERGYVVSREQLRDAIGDAVDDGVVAAAEQSDSVSEELLVAALDWMNRSAKRQYNEHYEA